MNNLVLQSFIIPVCQLNRHKSITKLYGTAFFASSRGIWFTAKHVIEEMLLDKKDQPQNYYGFCVKKLPCMSENQFIVIEEWEFAPQNLDIAIGKTEYLPNSPIKLSKQNPEILQNVSTLGYPSDASEYSNECLWLDLRCHKGYINRCCSTEALKLRGQQDCVEVSFSMELGMSGSPLIIDNSWLVAGIFTGTNQSQAYQTRITKQSSEPEFVPRCQEFGVACKFSSNSFTTWKPSCLSDEDYAKLFI